MRRNSSSTPLTLADSPKLSHSSVVTSHNATEQFPSPTCYPKSRDGSRLILADPSSRFQSGRLATKSFTSETLRLNPSGFKDLAAKSSYSVDSKRPQIREGVPSASVASGAVAPLERFRWPAVRVLS